MTTDIHVHIIGTGAGGTGCSMRIGWRKLLAPLVLRHIGLPARTLDHDFDRFYIEHLLALVRDSCLDAAAILAMDHVYNQRGERMPQRELFYVPNEYVLALSDQHPEFLPVVSIHPARRDALEELERCLASGATLLKLLPLYQNVDCNDKRYTHFWERMAEAGLPLLVHTGGEHTVPNNAPAYADPTTMSLPLECGVTVIAAHSATKSGLFDRDYLDVLIAMMERYKGFYAECPLGIDAGPD
jgi:predicted TIM-barrel fold metal-dependent hydrolase